MDPLFSDHNPLSVTLAEPVGVRTKLFKFYNYLSNYPEFQQTITDHWGRPVAGFVMLIIWNKLKQTKQGIKSLVTADSQGVEYKVRTARKKLMAMQYEMRDATRFTKLIPTKIEAKKQF